MRSVDARPRAGPGPRIVAGAAGVGLVGSGAWAFLFPGSFYETLATFPPPNVHLLRDIGAFLIGLGAVLVFSLAWSDALLAGLAGVAVGSALHLVSHVVDLDRGGSPVRDLVLLSLLTAALAGGAALRWGELRQRDARQVGDGGP
ncbi:MAG TPA: hypothetical protein VHL78_04480 [Actinomycetota bacterium]|nr:hypothetical protein [Actinomycetota bacterium]